MSRRELIITRLLRGEEIFPMESNVSMAFAYLRVLLVDTDANYRDKLERELRLAGVFDIVTAPSNGIARYMLEKIDCDVAVIERDDDAVELLAILSDRRAAGTLVIAIARDEDMIERHPELFDGFDEVMIKATAQARIVATIAASLARSGDWRSRSAGRRDPVGQEDRAAGQPEDVRQAS